MEADISLLDATKIRMLVIPVGKITLTKFNSYRDIISSFNSVELRELTYEENLAPFFKKSAIQDGFISFEYVTTPVPKSDWDEFQIHRRALGIIGIVDCQNTTSLGEVSQEFRQLVAKFPGVLCTRCFAFEPSDAQIDNEPGIVMIPNQGRDQLMFYLGTMIEDLAVNFLKTLSPLVSVIEEKSTIISPIPGSLESSKAADPTRSTDIMNAIKKKTQGRAQKYIADICLVGGSTRVANKIYTSSLETARLNSDLLWIAGSMEGLCSSQFLLEMKEHGAKGSSPPYSAEYTERYREIIALYEKCGAHMLAVEAAFKISTYLMKYRRKVLTADVLNESFKVCKKLSEDDQVRVLASLASSFKKIGFLRKYSFFLGLLSQKFSDQSKENLSSVIFTKALKFYNIHSFESMVTDSPIRQLRTVDWPQIQIYALREMIRLSETGKDENKVIHYTNYLLCRMFKNLEKADQISFIGKLTSFAQRRKTLRGPSSIFEEVPKVRKMTVQMQPPRLTPIKEKNLNYVPPSDSPVEGAPAAPHDPFIYNPFRGANAKAEIILVQNENVHVSVKLYNPLSVSIVVQHIHLSTSGVEFEAQSTSLSLPALQESDLVLTGRATQPGTLTIRGCFITLFNVTQEYLFPKEPGKKVAKKKESKDKDKDKDTDAEPEFITLTVIEELPYLDVAENHMLAHSIGILEGEKFTALMEIENVGTRPVNYMKITFEEKFPDGLSYEEDYYFSQQPLLTCDEKKIQLPLMPFESVFVPIQIIGKYQSSGGILKVQYGFLLPQRNDPFNYVRCIEFPVSLAVARPLTFFNSNIGNFQDLERLDNLAGSLHRPISLVKQEEVKSDLALSPKDFFFVSFNVQNSWPTSFDLQFTAKGNQEGNPLQTVMSRIDKGCGQRVVVCLRRFTLDDAHVKHSLPTIRNKQFVITQESESLDKEIFWYKKAIIDQISLEWRLGSLLGKLSIHQIKLSKSDLEFIKKERVAITTSLVLTPENVPVLTAISNEGLVHRCAAGQFYTLGISLKNEHNIPLKLHLITKPCIRFGKGFKTVDLTSKLMWTGTFEHLTPRIPPGGDHSHSVSFSFLSCGTYSMSIYCIDPSSPPESSLASITFVNILVT